MGTLLHNSWQDWYNRYLNNHLDLILMESRMRAEREGPICPACADGDHDQPPSVTTDLFKCKCPCHGEEATK